MASRSRRAGAFALDPALLAGLRRRRWAIGLGVLLVGAFALWVLGLPHNPPCCYNDEVSTNFNAWSIAHGGRDEYGAHFPLFFRAFGEYRSPGEIYLLAGLIKVFGAHPLIGRYLTRAAMFLAIALVGWLAARISGRTWIGVAVAALGLTTPMLYEVSRLGTEAPVFDLPLAAYLAGVFFLSRRERWPVWAGAALAAPLVLMAYTYPIGRPLAPLFALALVVFARRSRWVAIGVCWLLVAALMAPILAFEHRHPGALSAYPGELTWYRSSQLPFDAAWQFVSHLARNLNPWKVLADGDANPRHHIGPIGAVLVPLWLMSLVGLALVLTRLRRDRWWLFVVLVQLLVLVPGTLTRSVLHTPRLIAVPIPALLLCVPALQALARLEARRVIAAGLVLVTAVEVGFFVRSYVRDGTDLVRVATFQGDFVPAWRAAQKTGRRPIWLLDVASIHGLWQGVVDGVPRTDLVRWLRPNDPYAQTVPPGDVVQFVPQPGAVVIAGERCQNCDTLYPGPNYTTWIQK